MTKPIENLNSTDAQAFRSAIEPHVEAVLDSLIAVPAETARDQAIAAKAGAEAARDATITAKGEAQAAVATSQTARDAALSAKTGAETARDSAVAAKTDAATARDAALAAKASAETVHQDYLNVFSSFDQSLVGSTVMRFKDGSGRVVASLDQDASVGLTFNVPVSLPAGSLSLGSLKGTPLALSADTAVGYAFRIMDATGRMLMGIPADYPASPIHMTTHRARYADAFAGEVDSTGTYYLGGTIDPVTGQQTLWTRKVAGGDKAAITTSGHAMAPRVQGANAVWIDDTSKQPMYAPLDGSDKARRVLPTTAIAIIGDSTGGTVEAGIASWVVAQGRFLYSGFSVGGQNSQQIAARFGVPGMLTITFPGGTIAASGATSCTTAFTASPIRPGWDFLEGSGTDNTGVDVGVVVQVAGVTGVITRTWSGSAGVMTFTPLTALGSALAVGTGALPLTVLSMAYYGAGGAGNAARLIAGGGNYSTVGGYTPVDDLRGGTLVIRTGRNDIGQSGYTLASSLAYIQNIVARMTPFFKQVLVCGVMQGYGLIPTSKGGTSTNTEAQALAAFQADYAFNAALSAAFGSAYIDPMANHIALTTSSNSYTAQVTLVSTVVTYFTSSISDDGTHENVQGRANTVNLITGKITSKGF